MAGNVDDPLSRRRSMLATRHNMWRHVYLLFALVSHSVTYIVKPGQKYPSTKGEVWPKPQEQLKTNTYYVLESDKAFRVTKPFHTCDILEMGVNRLLYQNLAHKYNVIRQESNKQNTTTKHNDKFFNGTLSWNKTIFRIELTEACEDYPYFEMDEIYKLDVRDNIVLSSASIWGVLRGLQSFNHLLHYSEDYSEIRLNATTIKDYPAYTYRGLLIDTGRHFLSVDKILLIIDAMEMDKINVLHWHIVDDQSFPYQSEKFPNLSKKGAFHPSLVYAKEDIQRIIEHARLAGIRVLPEFDIPAHVRSWGEGYPGILTKCYKDNKEIGLGPLDPTNNETYRLLQQLYQEVTTLFPDEYVHLGGDEVDSDCWLSNPNITRYMKEYNIKTMTRLQAEFMNKIKSLLPPKAKYILWQEVFDSGVPLPSKTIIQVWKNKWTREIVKLLEADKRVVFSSGWYLDDLSKTWMDYYRADPRSMVYMERRNKLSLEDIVGGEVCMWGEIADDTNIFNRIWPRASAVAERLWTGVSLFMVDGKKSDKYKTIFKKDLVTDEVRCRLEEHTCRMHHIGIPAEPPNGPGFCIRGSPFYPFRGITKGRRKYRRKDRRGTNVHNRNATITKSSQGI